MVVDFLRGRMFGFLDTGLNLVHVDDVAAGHLLAARHGRVGERYILGNRNCTLAEMFLMLARITGLPAPRHRIPYALAWTLASLNERWSTWTGRPPRVPLTGVRMARKHMYFDSAKAVRDLGLPQTPVEDALRDAVEWFVAHEYAPRPQAMRAPA
jgi:dihydroflavonol-4-reductase